MVKVLIVDAALSSCRYMHKDRFSYPGKVVRKGLLLRKAIAGQD